MNSDNLKKTTLLTLNILAAYLGLSLLAAAAGFSPILLFPGEFLYRCYHISGFYIPLLLGAFSWIASRKEFPRRLFYSLLLSLIPFFTLALSESILRESGPAASYFIIAFGRPMGVLLLSLLTGVEILLIIKGGEFLFSDERGETAGQKTRIDWNRIKEYLAGALGFVAEEEETREESISRDVPTTERDEERDIPNRETVQMEGESPIEWEDVNLEPLEMPSFPTPAEPVPEEPYSRESTGEDRVQEMIRQVLTGRNSADEVSLKRAPQFPVVPPPPVQDRITPPEFSPEEEDIYRNDPILENPVVPDEPVREESVYEEDFPMEESVYPPEPLAEDPAYRELAAFDEEMVPEDDPLLEELRHYEPVSPADEEQLNSLIHDLDETLNDSLREMEEEERPESISDKLAPEKEESSYGEDLPDPPAPPRNRRKGIYKVPVEGLLAVYPDDGNKEIDDDTRKAARILEETLREFKIEAEVTGISRGPVITMFELLPAPGVKLNRIVALQDNIALRLAASRVRIVAPIPGKHAVGIEIPNKKRSIVAFSELIMCREMKKKDVAVPIVLGEDISGDSQVIDLARTPHLLIAGSTGSGKSVCVNSLICSILYHRNPEDVKMILVDPKIVELKLYNDIPHLLTPVITEPKRAFQAIQWTLYEMERRYALLDGLGVRDIKTYNKRILERDIATTKLPYIVVVIDEFADLMATSGKELEGIIARLAAMSRAVGIHLVLATQRPSTDVITGVIKANFPSRVAFMVASMTDSRIIIDSAGAEKLLGRGDMLFTSSWDPFPSRVQGAFLSEEEVERVVDYVKTLGEPDYIDDEIFVDEPDDDFELKGDDGSDALFDEALEIVVQSGKASASYLQRRLKIGYNRAARLVEEMEMRGIVGPSNGSKPREILHIPT
ncbi:MAG: DNA translocase FtsK [Spirochaetales bacterium]|nr:DNA translocase FtsK [Spirochaetales bacterium]